MSAIAASTQLNLPLHPDEPTLSSDLSTGGPIVAETKLKKNVLTYTQRKAIDAKLAEVLLPAGDAGQVMWAEGWSDAKVAESMPFACTHHNVHGVRTEVYGPLVDAPEPSPLVDRVVRLERIVKFLAESLGQDMSELEAKCA